MSRLQGLLLSCVVLAGALAAPAFAQVGGHPFEGAASAGLFHYDARARIHDGPAYGFTAGIRSDVIPYASHARPKFCP